MKRHGTAKTLTLAMLGMTAASFGVGCSSGSGGNNTSALPADVRAVMFLQRVARTDNGNVFDYTSYEPGGRLVMLEPPSADGKLSVIFPPEGVADYEGADIMSYDLSFDANSVVVSARVPHFGDQYQLFSMNLDGTNLSQLTEGGNDYVYPLYLPGGKVFFTTNRNVEADAPQFRDEYERQTTAQVGTITIDGKNLTLGPRNVSHRVAPTLLPDGRVLYTEWRHMGMVNDGHLRMMNSDMTGMREAFGGEEGGQAGTNSYLKARYVQTKTLEDGTTDYQVVAVATSRDRTLQSGKLFLIDLNGTEEASRKTDLTPLVPGGNTKSEVGRYYDAEVVGDPTNQQFLVSWADGPVESEILALANTQPNFGIYLFDARRGTQFPIYDDPRYWDVLARPVKARTEPTATESPVSGTSTTIAALNVYDSSVLIIPPGSVQKVRIIEGFSGEEGPSTFGTTEFDGQSLYGEIPIQADNSFAAKVPGNVPFHIQLIDKFALSIANESIWISGRAGEQRTCGGCHEDRAKTAQLAPGQIDAVVAGAVNLDVARPLRVSTTAFQLSGAGAVADASSLRGIPWDMAIQPILTAKCATCHDGDASKSYNPSFTITDMTTGTAQTFTFDLRGEKLNVMVGERMTGDFTASYLSLMGLGEMLGEDVVSIEGPYRPEGYVEAGSAKDSYVIELMNPPQRFPNVDMGVRKFVPTASSPPDTAGHRDMLTADEAYLLILNIDMGGQFFFRENASSATQY